MNLISSPNLPKKDVCAFITDATVENVLVIAPPKISSLPSSLSRHADLGIVFVSANKAVCPPETCAYYKSALAPFKIEIIRGNTSLGSNYPEDCAYNVCIVGKKCFLNKNVCDSVLYDILIKEGYEMIFVKQGYTKCSICPLDENTLITADRKIAYEASKCAMEVLLISNEGISLSGYSNGFFGGSCGLGGKSTLLLNGETACMASGAEIEKFTSRKGIFIKSLKKGEIVDIGSVLPLATY